MMSIIIALITVTITGVSFNLYYAETTVSEDKVDKKIEERLAPFIVQMSENDKRSVENNAELMLIRERQDEIRIILTRLEASQIIDPRKNNP